MRSLFFDDRYLEIYGAQENVLQMAKLAEGLGHDVVFVTTAEGALAAEARRRQLPVRVVTAPASLRRFEGTTLSGGPLHLLRFASDLVRYNFALGQLVREWSPDVVVSAAVRPSTLLLGSRLLVRAPQILYAQNSIPRGLLAALVGLASTQIWLIGPGARPTFPSWFQRLCSRRFRDHPSGRDLGSFSVSERRWGRQPVPVVTVSSLTRRKGIHLLIDALAKVEAQGHRTTLVVVGGANEPISEQYAAELQDQAGKESLDVRFVGWQDDVRAYLSEAELFVLASENEGLPGVLIEAMASGLPCVTTRAGSAGALIDEAGAGASVAVGDVDGLASAIGRLCMSGAERRGHGERGRVYVEEQLGLEAWADRLAVMLEETVSEYKRAAR